MNDPARWLRTSEFRQQAMYLDTITYLPDDLLVKTDRAAMAFGLETRMPLLDHHVIEFAWRLPFAMKVNHGEQKWILRQVLHRDVPPELVDRPKQGFSTPLEAWLTGPLRDSAESLLSPARLRQDGFLSPEPIREKWAALLPGDRNRIKHHLWTILMFQSWLEQI